MKNLVKMSCAFFVIFSIAGAALSQTMSEAEYNQYLLKSLKDENIGIRTSAAQLLGERKVQEAVDPLLKMLKSEKHYGARIVAAVALFNIGDQKALPELQKLAKCDKCKSVRTVAACIVLKMQTIEIAQK
jgi:HEAT repeat protein